MRYPVTYKALKAFGFVFFLLAILVVGFALITGVFGNFESTDPQWSLAVSRLGRLSMFLFGAIYGLTFLFLGFVSRALSHLVGEI